MRNIFIADRANDCRIIENNPNNYAAARAASDSQNKKTVKNLKLNAFMRARAY